MTRRFARTRPLALALTCLTIASCGETPTEPDAEPESLVSQANLTAAALEFRQLSADWEHTCGVSTSGQAYCWGQNGHGQLGDGTNTGRPRPAVVLGGLSFRQVSTAYGNSCGVTTDYQAYCWGDNSSGQLGDGTRTQRLKPVAVAGGLRFVQVSAGSSNTCGLTYPDRRAYCWGDNSSGQLGDGTQTQRLRPVPVAGGRRYSQVSTGQRHTCGVTPMYEAYCWGSNSWGQLGNGTRTTRLRPVLVIGGYQFKQLDAGGWHTCAVTTGAQAFCWGYGSSGQLGVGTDYARPRPQPVAGRLSFSRVSAGWWHTCGETTQNRLYCWGHDSSGQLGDDGTLSDRLTPVTVTGGLYFAQVSAGAWHTCGKTPTAVAYCWGDNTVGQLGDGTSTSRLSPTRVAGTM